MKTALTAVALAIATTTAAYSQDASGKWILMVAPPFYAARASSYQATVNTTQYDDAHQCDVTKTALEYILKNNRPATPGVVWCAYVPGI